MFWHLLNILLVYKSEPKKKKNQIEKYSFIPLVFVRIDFVLFILYFCRRSLFYWLSHLILKIYAQMR